MPLFAKECLLPLRIQKYEALDPRLIPNHPIRSTLLTEHNNWMAGYKGEKSLDFYLSMLPEEKYLIFHNLRILLGKYFFQIDILLLSAAFGLVLEVKNRTGEYHFQKHLNQTTLKNKRIRNPVLQARVQAIKLNMWLQKYHLPAFPIQYFFVNSNENATIRIEHGNEQILRYISNSEGLLEKISQTANSNKKEILDPKELRKIKRLLLTNDTPENLDILHHFHLSQQEILPGVFCPDCNHLPIIYTNGTWVCPKCQSKSKTAHHPAVNDYFLLIKPTITNAELRQFLHIPSPRSANNLLGHMNLTASGTYKGRVYTPKDPIWV